MGCSEAQLAANRANALRSTGPRTEVGKERSRQNAVKHGLTGAGIALPTEDAAAIEARFAEFAADLQPRGGVERFLVQRAALLSVRLDRAALQETARLTAAIRTQGDEAEQDGDDAGLARFRAAVRSRPATARGELLGDAEGAAQLIAGLSALRAKLAEERTWTRDDAAMLEAALGHDPAALPARTRLLSDVVLGDFTQLKSAETATLDAAGKRRWACGRLATLIGDEIEPLRVLRATLPPPGPSARPAAHRAMFDDSPTAILARRYEASTQRAFVETLRLIRQHQAQPESRQQVADFEAFAQAAELGSFGIPTPASPGRAPLAPAPESRAGFGLDRGPDRPIRRPERVTIGRPPAG